MPIDYSVTRKTLAKELRQGDVLRPYLPSLPYVDDTVDETEKYVRKAKTIISEER